ncbi:TonB-dependent receptor [Ramlibacter albus]|uniref:TonB-dependent receptor n=1 Tax=Ramlibacter albus TaxID=2079448 RepID=A0A923S0F5_9BURK|nr:TonB-dependent receptor [Ramlibacter albus]MBC5763205.1 TonB-dependent receptor [Ramlibacter albus]
MKKAAIAGGLIMGVAAPAALAQTTLEPVTITANKREERLQHVPATATVVPSQQLDQQNITTVQDLARAVPSFDASPAGLRIRSFGGISFSLTAESSVGILVDGVSLSGAADFPPELFDVERIEVLEGPQGTLFGKNASAGIINIVTKAPDPRRLGSALRVDAQSRDGRSVQAALNVPVTEALAFRVAGSVVNEPRSTHNLFDGAWDSPHKTNARLRVRWKATPDVLVNLSGDQSDTILRGGGRWTLYQTTPGSVLTRALNACGVIVGPENTDVCANPGQNGNKTRVGGYSAQVDWALGNYLLTSVSAVRDVKNIISGADYDMISVAAPGFVQPEIKTYHNLSQELRVTSPEYDWGNFVAGAYWFKGRIHQDLTGVLTLPTFRLGQRNLVDGENESTALFGQGTYKFNKALSLNFGARAGREEASTSRTGALTPGAVGPVEAQRLIPVAAQTKDSYASWRGGLQYDFDADRMGYVTYSHGYKGPAVNHNATNPRVPAVVRPEIPKMLEAGLKNQFLQGRFAVNASAYTMKVKDYQATVWDPGALAFAFSNAPELTVRGAVLNFYGKPVQALTLNGGVAYTRSKLGPGFLVECAMGSPTGCFRDAAGDPAGGTPKLRATFVFDYAFAVASLRASLGGDVVYTSEKVFDRTDPARNLPATTIVGARFTLRRADDMAGLALYARNLTDRFSPTYRVGNLVAFVTGDTRSYTQFVGPESRRLVGVSFDAKF